MNIKQSLHFSNLLMLIIPLVLGILAASASMFFITHVVYREWTEKMRGQDEFFKKRDALYKDTIKMLNITDYSERISKESKLKIKAFRDGTKIQVCSNGTIIFETDNITNDDRNLMHTALEITGGGIISLGNIELLSREFSYQDTKATVLIVSSVNIERGKTPTGRLKRQMTSTVLISVFIAVLIIAVLVMNRVMTRFVFCKIWDPLTKITYGVHQIRDGNLDYVIDCDVPDEFLQVCSDFNSMALRLKTSVQDGRTHEQNRKELLAGISHDLRTPLTSISAYIQGLIDDIPQTPEQRRRYMETIKQKSDDIVRIVDKLFLFSKLDLEDSPFYPEPITINNALKDFYMQNRDYYTQNNVTLKLQLQNKETIVHIDPVQLQNALNNIVENSLKYRTKNNCAVVISAESDTTAAKITIEDDGPGVPEDALSKLFTVFYRADPSRSNKRSGSGLGLAITSKILTKQGGSIYAENIHDGDNNVCGLRIVILIPLSAPTESQSAEES